MNVLCAILLYLQQTKYLNVIEIDKNTRLYIQGDGITATAIVGQDITLFADTATTSAFTRTLVGQDNRLDDLYIRAINNRTRERNYFKLYSSLLRGDISDEDFDEEIDKNENVRFIHVERIVRA